jgi:hypothetical protein
MLSPFRRRKNALIFYRFDQSKDGLVRADDIETWGQEEAKHLNIAQGSPQYDTLMETYRQVWLLFFKAFDTDNDNAVTLDDFFENIVVFQEPEAREQVMSAHEALFDVLDLDDDGRIELNEYTAFVKPLGSSEQDASRAFRHLDRDGDGFISRDEFAQALYDYFHSDDRSAPGNWFFGSY